MRVTFSSPRRAPVSLLLVYSLGAVAAACTPSGGNVATSTSTTAPTAPVSPPPPINVAQLDSLIRKTVVAKHFVGLSVGVAQGGKVVFAKGYGLRALGGHDSVSTETMFAVGSVTKQFTC